MLPDYFLQCGLSEEIYLVRVLEKDSSGSHLSLLCSSHLRQNNGSLFSWCSEELSAGRAILFLPWRLVVVMGLVCFSYLECWKIKGLSDSSWAWNALLHQAVKHFLLQLQLWVLLLLPICEAHSSVINSIKSAFKFLRIFVLSLRNMHLSSSS